MLQKLSDAAGWALFFVIFVTLVGACTPKDDTDPPEGRSGMSLHTDHLTGCQYLSKPLGGITPRVDGRGRHLGCKE